MILQHNHQAVDPEIDSTVRADEEVRHIRDHLSYSISDEEGLKEIPETKRNTNYNSCTQCGYIAYWKNNLVSHLQTHHRELEDEKQNRQHKTEGGMQYEDNAKDINDLKLER